MKKLSYVLIGLIALTTQFAGCGGPETTEVEVTTYDQSVEDRMAERGREMMSQSERRKAEQ